MKQLFLLAALICFGMAAIKFCTARMKPNNTAPKRQTDLTPEEAKARMEANPDLILLDVRTQEEYDDGHIPGAVCLPSEMIEEGMPFSFDKDAEILLYCHSDKRSAESASKLRAMGYTNVSDIGCILDWPYDIITE